MNKQKYTILYSRLSRDDGEDSVSNSIKNQQSILEEYAERNGLVPFLHIKDDGFSGTNFDRPGWTELMKMVDADEVCAILFKTMDRMGRDYLRVGMYRQEFREKGIRIIAVSENYDSFLGEDDFLPFREIMAEWYARDTSRKIKSVINAKGNAGIPLGSQAPYGYMKNPNDKTRWIIDPESATVVRRIFSMTIDGMGTWAIAETLHDEEVECPSYYFSSRGIGSHKSNYDKEHPYAWSYNTVGQILTRLEYLGHVCNFKGEKANFKSKKYTRKPKDEWVIFENVHEPIISQETFDLVQKIRSTNRRINNVTGISNPLTGILYCADCGRKMYNKRYKKSDYYNCSTYKFGENKFEEFCSPHHVTTAAVNTIILDVLKRTSNYVRNHEVDFINLVRQKSSLQQSENLKFSKKQITKSKRRIEELDKLIISIYEDKVKGILNEERFLVMASNYEQEQADLKAQTLSLQTELEKYEADTENAEKFIRFVRQYTQFDELTTTMLNELVEKVIVHEGEWSEGKNPTTGRGMGTRRQHIEVFLKYIGDMEIPDVRTQAEIEAEIAEVEKAEKRLTRLRENRRRFVAGETKKKNN